MSTKKNDTTDLAKVPLEQLPVNYSTLQALHASPTVPARYQKSPTGVNDMYTTTIVGRELGIGPFTAIYEIYMVNGQASMSGKMMLALVWRAGHKITAVIEETGSTVQCWRRFDGVLEHVGDVEFTIEDAARAGLLDKGTYEQYPKTMLTWRAVSMACRIYFPDVILGVGYVPEEVGIEADMDTIPEGVIVNEDAHLEMENAVIVMENVLDAEVLGDYDGKEG
jgi:hypothetical protein